MYTFMHFMLHMFYSVRRVSCSRISYELTNLGSYTLLQLSDDRATGSECRWSRTALAYSQLFSTVLWKLIRCVILKIFAHQSKKHGSEERKYKRS